MLPLNLSIYALYQFILFFFFFFQRQLREASNFSNPSVLLQKKQKRTGRDQHILRCIFSTESEPYDDLEISEIRISRTLSPLRQSPDDHRVGSDFTDQ